MIAELKKTYSVSNSVLARQFSISYTTLMRWKRRLSKGQSAVNKPGPKKVEPLDLGQLRRKIKELDHGEKRSHATGRLHAAFNAAISRRELPRRAEVPFDSAYKFMATFHRVPEWDEEPRLQGEMDSLGLYLTGHPITRYEKELAHIISGKLAEVTAQCATAPPAPTSGKKEYRGRQGSDERAVTIAGLVMSMRVIKTQRGGRIAFLTMDDRTARIDVRVFPDVYEKYQAMLAKNKVLVIQGGLGLDDFSGSYQVTAQSIYDINQARALFARRLVVGVESSQAGNGFVGTLADILQPDLCAAGGFSEMMKIVAMASAANIPVIPHVWGTNVGLEAALQLFAALPHFPERRFPAEPFFEYDRSKHPLREGVTHEKFTLHNGYLDIPDRPGIGVSLDMDFIGKYTI